MSESVKLALLSILIAAIIVVGLMIQQRFDAIDAQLSVLVTAASDSGGEHD